MRFLILSDIHSNLEALNTVLEHAAGQYDQVLCCGDIVGYGPDPNAVIERIREFNARVIRGNHEKAALGLVDLSLFNPLAKRAALWTQDELTVDSRSYLKEIQAGPLDVPPLTLVHDSQGKLLIAEGFPPYQVGEIRREMYILAMLSGVCLLIGLTMVWARYKA